jgi:hypothetical protein
MYMKHPHRWIFTGMTVFVFCFIAYAKPSYTGRTLKSGSAGCGSCHASQNSAVIVELTGPDSLTAGKDGVYFVKISGGGGSSVCVDIATSAGTLKTNDGNLKLSSSELITNGVKSYSGGSYTYSFKLTAPTTAQNVTLYATGMSTKSTYNFAPNKTVKIVSATTGIDAGTAVLLKSFALLQNYPNPFGSEISGNSSTSIGFTLKESASVRISVYDATGRNVSEVTNTRMEAGTYQLPWNAAALPGGVYFYRMTATTKSGISTSELRKMLFMK